ncbi:hypothetical protein OIU85_002974 [Salix viminalis]|uniref:Uncharacterized protein n=1 Tax=Salix viminalis TaxID=40686 RepID=A0A9Q0PY61_SALVM|nr:hypothetical protein OIU85_002974 [Salix viminalis]
MECLKRRRARIFNNKPSLFHYVISFTIFFFFFFFFLLSFVSLFTSDTSCPGIRYPLSDQKADNFYFQDFEKTGGCDEQMEVSLSMARRFLSGPGIISTAVHVQVWQLHPVQAGACGYATGDSGYC